MSRLPNWYGIKGIKYRFINEWADPEIIYKGRRCSCYVVEDTMWERFLEEGNPQDIDAFDAYMLEHADNVRELCEIALFPEVV